METSTIDKDTCRNRVDKTRNKHKNYMEHIDNATTPIEQRVNKHTHDHQTPKPNERHMNYIETVTTINEHAMPHIGQAIQSNEQH